MHLHHIAYVTENLEDKAEYFCRVLGFARSGDVIIDENQGVRILFLDMGRGEKLELLQPLSPDSPVQCHLKKGGGLYHLCFEVDDLDDTLKRMQKDHNAMVVKEPLSAPALDQQRMAFVVTEQLDLIEFVESKKI